MTYWDLNKFDVEDLMDTLLKKSLAECDYDQTLESYVYHIHDLQLDYLKSQLDFETLCETRCSRVKRTSKNFGSIVCYWSCSPPAAEYAMAIVCQFSQPTFPCCPRASWERVDWRLFDCS